MLKYKIGIDTLSYYYVLIPRQKSAIVRKLNLLPDFLGTEIIGKNNHLP